MRKLLLATASSVELNSMIINSNFSKVVSYIQDNKDWERCYVILKIIVLVFCYFFWNIIKNKGWMKKCSIQKSYSDIDNEDTLSLSGSSKNVWNLSDIDDEDKEILNIDDSDISDYNMSESLSSLI